MAWLASLPSALTLAGVSCLSSSHAKCWRFEQRYVLPPWRCTSHDEEAMHIEKRAILWFSWVTLWKLEQRLSKLLFFLRSNWTNNSYNVGLLWEFVATWGWTLEVQQKQHYWSGTWDKNQLHSSSQGLKSSSEHLALLNALPKKKLRKRETVHQPPAQ